MSGLTFQDDLHVLNKRGDNYINFQPARQDTGTAGVQYYAWMSSVGEYIFMKRDTSDSSDVTTLYYFGKIADEVFQTAWDDRANKSYVEYNALFT